MDLIKSKLIEYQLHTKTFTDVFIWTSLIALTKLQFQINVK